MQHLPCLARSQVTLAPPFPRCHEALDAPGDGRLMVHQSLRSSRFGEQWGVTCKLVICLHPAFGDVRFAGVLWIETIRYAAAMPIGIGVVPGGSPVPSLIIHRRRRRLLDREPPLNTSASHQEGIYPHWVGRERQAQLPGTGAPDWPLAGMLLLHAEFLEYSTEHHPPSRGGEGARGDCTRSVRRRDYMDRIGAMTTLRIMFLTGVCTRCNLLFEVS